MALPDDSTLKVNSIKVHIFVTLVEFQIRLIKITEALIQRDLCLLPESNRGSFASWANV